MGEDRALTDNTLTMPRFDLQADVFMFLKSKLNRVEQMLVGSTSNTADSRG